MKCEIYDLHSHILPGIDDGSKDMRETIRMLKEEIAQGVSHIAFTPHFYAHRQKVGQYLLDRERVYAEVKEWVASELAGVEIKLAAEVYFFQGMGQSELLSQLCLEGTDYVFVEMPFCQWDDAVLREIESIFDKLGLQVMIVHIERYYPFQKDKAIWKEVFSLPVIPQINAGAFADFRERRIVNKFLKKGYPVVLGSDCHNMYSRRPNLSEGRKYLRGKYGEEMLDGVDERSKMIWEGSEGILTSVI